MERDGTKEQTRIKERKRGREKERERERERWSRRKECRPRTGWQLPEPGGSQWSRTLLERRKERQKAGKSTERRELDPSYFRFPPTNTTIFHRVSLETTEFCMTAQWKQNPRPADGAGLQEMASRIDAPNYIFLRKMKKQHAPRAVFCFNRLVTRRTSVAYRRIGLRT